MLGGTDPIDWPIRSENELVSMTKAVKRQPLNYQKFM